jgi:hypothetical protein
VRAAQGEAPPKGVLGEGNRKTVVAGVTARAAAPLHEPMGRTLFSDLAKPLKGADAAGVAVKPDALFGAVRKLRRTIADRSLS